MGLSQLGLEPGDLLSMLLILSPAQKCSVKPFALPRWVDSCIQVKAPTAVSGIPSAAR